MSKIFVLVNARKGGFNGVRPGDTIEVTAEEKEYYEQNGFVESDEYNKPKPQPVAEPQVPENTLGQDADNVDKLLGELGSDTATQGAGNSNQEPVQYTKLNKEELTKYAQTLGVEVKEEDTKAMIITAIEEKLATQGAGN